MAPRGSPEDPKVTALRESRCLNPHPEQVTDEAFLSEEFFDARDAVQVKYEMVRRVTRRRRAGHRDSGGVRVLPAVVLPGRRRAGRVRAGRAGAGQARAPRRPQAHRAGPGLGRAAAGGRSGAEAGRPGRSHRRGVRGARAPPLRRASAGPPAGALQKPLTCPPPSAGRRRTRPCPCDPHLAARLLNQARRSGPGCRPGSCSRRRAGCPLRAAASCRPARTRERVPARPRRAHRQGRHRLAARPGPPDLRTRHQHRTTRGTGTTRRAGAAAGAGDHRARPRPGRARRRPGRHLTPSLRHDPALQGRGRSTRAHRHRLLEGDRRPSLQDRPALCPPVQPQAGPAQHRVRDPPVRPARQGDQRWAGPPARSP